MGTELTLNWIFLLSLGNYLILFIGLVAIERKISSLKTYLMEVKPEKKPVHERALNNRFVTGLHLALLFEGFTWEPTWHGIKYTGDLVPEGLNIFLIFGNDWDGNQFDETYVEIQINKETLNIEKVKRFHWYHYRSFILKKDYEKYLDKTIKD